MVDTLRIAEDYVLLLSIAKAQSLEVNETSSPYGFIQEFFAFNAILYGQFAKLKALTQTVVDSLTYLAIVSKCTIEIAETCNLCYKL